MKSLAVFALILSLVPSVAVAKTLQLPAEHPLVQVDVPTAWKTVQDKDGDLRVTHKKGDMFIGVMTVDMSQAEAVTKTMIETIAKEGFTYDASTVANKDGITLGSLQHVSEMTAVAYKGAPYDVVFNFAPLDDKKMMIVFYLGSQKDSKAYAEDISALVSAFEKVEDEDDDD